MTSLKIADAGWVLRSSSGDDGSLPLQAFGLTLDSSVVEDMIRAVQSSETVQLSLGKSPTIHYGSKSHRILPSDNTPFDIYVTKPFESTKVAERVPNTGSLFSKPRLPSKASGKSIAKSKKGALDSDIEALQNGLAAHEASRDRARMVERGPNTKRSTKTKHGLLSGYNSAPRSLPTSPGHKPNVSPSATPALSASQLAMERAKEQRFVLVHELAVQDRSSDYLKAKWQGKPEEFRSALEKVADKGTDTKLWSMRKSHWKELNVWKYDYDSQDERQKAIDNAVRQYDKQRLSASEPEWQKLLPKEERGKGKCLSRLQASLAKGPAQPAPKIKVQKADDSSTSRDDGDSVGSEKSKGGEPMSRSNSSSMSSKSKKASELPKKPVNANIKAPMKKTSPVKVRPAASKANGGRVLSQAIIENSDSSGDEAPPVKQKPSVPKDSTPVPARPPVSSQTKHQASKRPRDDEDSSSSSGTPLSKRLKQKQPLLSSKLKDRPSEAPPKERNGAAKSSTAAASKPKNTSPTKSSPLASSPPTNASEFDDDKPMTSKKRKVDETSKAVSSKRRATDNVSTAIVNKANKFKQYYQKYESLHYEIASLDNPPRDKVAHLRDMRDALATMKREIYRDCSPV